MRAHAHQPSVSSPAPSPDQAPELVPDNSWMQEQLRSTGSEAPPSDLLGLRLLSQAPRAPLPHPDLFSDEEEELEVHAGDPLTRAALRDLGASALAMDSVLAFAERSPSREQVAHELVHVRQGLGGQGLTAVSGRAEQQAQTAARAVASGEDPGPLVQTGAEAARDPDPVTAARDASQLQMLLNGAFTRRDLEGARSLRAALLAARNQAPAPFRRVTLGERVFWVDDPALAALESQASQLVTTLSPPVSPEVAALGAVPPRYERLGNEVIELLVRSRTRLFGGTTQDFWTQLDTLSPAQLRTLHAVLEGARANGLLRAIGTLTLIYEYGSSYGIEYLAAADPRPIVQGGAWCLDDPQSTVRAEHGNTDHEWWRHGSGAGRPGMHSGLDIGAGHHNLHWDTTNPSTGRGGRDVDTAWANLATPPGGPTYAPRPEVCGYGTGPLVDHARDIGWGPFSGDPHSPTRNQPSPFHEIEVLQHAATFAQQVATSYPEVHELYTGFPEANRQLLVQAAAVRALRERSRPLAAASAPESGPDPRVAERAALSREHQQVEHALFVALAAFFECVATVAPGDPELGTLSQPSGWTRQTSRIEEARGIYRRARERLRDPLRRPRDAGV